MKKLKTLTALTFCLLFISISANASLEAVDCHTVSFDTSQYDELWGCPDTPIDSDFVMIAIKGEKTGLVDSKGKVILPVIYDSVGADSFDKLLDNAHPDTIEFTYKNHEVTGVINGSGKIMAPEYSNENIVLGQLMLSKTEDGRAKLTHLSTQESVVYDHVTPFTLGSNNTRVINNGLWGMVNIDTMKVEIPIVYQMLYFFKNGLVIAQKNDNFGAIDDSNNIVVPFIYEDLTQFDTLSRYSSPVAIATPYEQAHFLVLNTSNKVVDTIPKPTSNASVIIFTKDLIAFRKQNGLTGIANWQGKVLFEPEEGYEIIALDEGYIYIDLASNQVEETKVSDANTDGEIFSYQYDKQQEKLTLVEMN